MDHFAYNPSAPPMEKKDSVTSTTMPSPKSPPEPPPLVHTLYEQLTETWQYVVACPVTRHAVIIDPHLDNNAGSSVTSISTIAADRVLSVVRQNRYIVDKILHTHEPTVHPSSAWYLRTQILESTGRAPHVQIGRKMQAVQRIFQRKYSMNDGSAWKTDFDTPDSYQDGSTFPIGQISCRVVHLQRGNLAFVIGNHIFAGTSKFEFEVRTRHESLVGNLKDHHIYGSRDQPPAKSGKMQLAPVYEFEGTKGPESIGKKKGSGRKLVIRYTAEEGL